ncbi:FAD-binding domain-containing protein [Trametopsis cervina]|nr:FAD-binding domain-containing protein [Trametopsis cervina]
MGMNTFLKLSLLLGGASAVLASSNSTASSASIKATCLAISKAVSNASAVFYPGSPTFATDMQRYYVTSAANATCDVEPGSVSDVSTILKILGQTTVPFSLKSGGHAYNPLDSSTPGIQLTLTRLNTIAYDPHTTHLTLGGGLRWDDVNAALDGSGRNVVGGRQQGVGVVGLLQGGGYSYFTSSAGLAADNVVSFEVVVPSGHVVNASATQNPDLFWALKGGYNNFGIVTHVTLKTYPQGPVWGGTIVYNTTYTDRLVAAVANFSANATDSQCELYFGFQWANNSLAMFAKIYYNASEPAPGVFDELLAIPAVDTQLSTMSFRELVGPEVMNARGRHSTYPTPTYTPSLIRAILNETITRGHAASQLDPSTIMIFAVQPFLRTLLTHAPEGSSAYPPSRSFAYMPSTIEWSWSDPSVDGVMNDGLRDATNSLKGVLEREGQVVDAAKAGVYGNFASQHVTTPEEVFGGSLGRLREVKRVWDPRDVMGRTGGWKVTL